ncbi:MAG: PBP1A family penicillin-binding protein [Acidobacteria bacterium]|nr:PBP1A family penicillin-binding protein [Acidobacteriota bacterium]MBV9067634.1 PBP1A family penicillin-binding protein [Acidobacteriota bacterium]MBV9188242.1 PBP1A family penicillin-binding protein [Acidobacteriota bacterium]
MSARRKSRLILIGIAIILGIPGGFVLAHAIRVPLVKSLENYQPAIITRIYDRNGIGFAEYSIQKRIVVAKRDMAPALVQAVVATEDADFYHHGGINPKAIFRAALKDIIARKKVEGASTLTQQLAKQVFLTPAKDFRRKINEAFLAVDIEKNFTKDQIFELYANQVYLGHGAYGVEAASRLYFGKHAKDLTVPEAALIAGLIRAPMYYSPITHMDHATARRNHVLRRMYEEHYVNKQQFQQALNAPIVLGTYKEEAPRVGAYFSEEIRQYIERSDKFGVENLYQRGLKVYSTLDLRMQIASETALQRGLRRWDRRRGFRKPARNLVTEGIDPSAYKDASWSNDAYVADKLYPAVVMAVDKNGVTARVGKDSMTLPAASFAWTQHKTMEGTLKTGDIIHIRLDEDTKTHAKKWMLDQLPQVQGAVVILDVKTGEVRALVGGYDFQMSKFNRAIQSRRQTGSSFKPFVYGAAFEKGLTPADTVFDEPVAIPVGNQIYSPKNYYGKYAGIVTIQRALELSINVPAVKTWMMVGANHVVDFAKRCGITSDIPRYPSTALGAAGVSPIEMAGAYNVFANQGVYVKPRMVRKIVDQTDRVLEEQLPELSEATQAQVAFELAHVMRGTIDRGTGYEAHILPPPLAGKTGTTNSYTDAWFLGFSPEYTIAVWTGYDDPSRSLGGGATGAEVALPIWIDIVKQLDAQKLRTPRPEFDIPPGIVMAPMDLKSGRRGIGPCERVITEAFIAGQEPDKDCSGATVAVSKLPYYLQKPFYQPKELEPTQAAQDASARSGEGAESPAPNVDEGPKTVAPPPTTTAPPATTTAPPPP